MTKIRNPKLDRFEKRPFSCHYGTGFAGMTARASFRLFA